MNIPGANIHVHDDGCDHDPRVLDVVDSMMSVAGGALESVRDGTTHPAVAVGGAWLHGLWVGLNLDRASAESLISALRRDPIVGESLGDTELAAFLRSLRVT